MQIDKNVTYFYFTTALTLVNFSSLQISIIPSFGTGSGIALEDVDV